uniref:Bromo adjacent homology domain-containing 1 protein-like n=1 Tax=Cynoglossus semilaevis TaxID=244447 RepID=A0A3P8US27_CYNSE
MTQARQKFSLRHSSSDTDWWDSGPLWPHGGTMDGSWTERSLRFGRTKKIAEIMKQWKEKKIAHKKERIDKVDQNRKLDRRRVKKWDRKLYPLRGRIGGSGDEALSCHVLLTRLEESNHEKEGSKKEEKKDGHRNISHKPKKDKNSAKGEVKDSAKCKSKSVSTKHGEYAHIFQPRKRRLASLNAEAVNSLLLERTSDPQPAAKQAMTQEEPANGVSPFETNPVRTNATVSLKTLRGIKGKTSKDVEVCQSSKTTKKRKNNLCLVRLAGLNAAALLKLTSSSATSKQRFKSPPTATVTSDSKLPVPACSPKQDPKKQEKKSSSPNSGCTACKKKADFEPKVEWETGTCPHQLTKPGYQSRSMLGFPLKQVKEEQVEAELSPYYCCPPEGSVEYCHRLAFYLALTLTPHPCLCTADHCFSSYYVHIAHPTHTGNSSPGMASRPLNFAPSSLCSNQMTGSKLLGSQMSHTSGLAHPAYCNSVASPCYGDACAMNGFTYRTMPSVTNRGCSFSTGCTGCTHSIKTESYTSAQGDHNPSLLVSPSLPITSCPLSSVPTSTQTKPHLLNPLSGRELTSQVPQPKARLKMNRESPQSIKTSSGSLSTGRTRLPHKQPSPVPSLISTKQKKVSRRRATNGWRPVGLPTEKEVFIAGEDETAVRQCYEGVERDGEVIRVRDTVLLRSGPRKKSLPYVAKISALWEDPKTGELMMSLFWYYRPEHTQGGRDPSAHCENEIFASRHQDENSVACIEDRCYVLPLAQYCRFCALVKRRAEGAQPGSASMVPCRPEFAPPSHRCVPTDVDPELVYLCRHVYDFRYGRILKNLQ